MGGREARRVVRVRLEKPLSVVMGSIGSAIRYDLETRDISNSGFFLDFAKPGRFPFTASSLMEVWIKVGDDKQVFFNGKMARVVFPNDEAAKVSGPGIAIRIVQISSEDEHHLVEFINAQLALQEASESDEATTKAAS